MAESDPVLSRSGFLCTYMSNHPDTLVAYVRYQGKVGKEVESARMTSISTKEMVLQYKPKGSNAESTVKIPFDPPLAGYEEVKPRLLSMKLDAQESLGMALRPQLKPYKFPFDAGLLILLPIALLIYTTYQPHGFAVPFLRSLVAPIGGVKTVWWFVAVVHGGEALYTLTLCLKHRTGFVDGFLYILGTLALGLPIIRDMRRRIQKMRIDSITKVH